LIEIRNVTLDPATVSASSQFAISAEVIYTKGIYKWADLAGMTWGEVSLLTWGELYSYRNPDHRDHGKPCGTFYSGQDFGF